MKTIRKKYFPERIEFEGEVYTVDNFLSKQFRLSPSSLQSIANDLTLNGFKSIFVEVLSHKKDFHGNSFPSQEYIFTNQHDKIIN